MLDGWWSVFHHSTEYLITGKLNSPTIAIIELILFGPAGGSAVSAFKSVRVFRTFRVLRVTRMIRSLQYMKIIMKVISNTLEKFIWIFFLLMLFNYIYALLGMTMYGGKFPSDIR